MVRFVTLLIADNSVLRWAVRYNELFNAVLQT